MLLSPLFSLINRRHKWPLLLKECSYREENDRSYEDALLDAQLRFYFQSEFGALEPGEDAFENLRLTLQTTDKTTTRSVVPTGPGRWEKLAATAQSLMARPIFGRLVPGAVALMLLITALGPNATHLLRAGEGQPYFGRYAQIEASPSSTETAQEQPQAPQPTIVNSEPLTGSNEADTDGLYDNGEIRMPTSHYVNPAQYSQPNQQQHTDEKRPRLGPQ